MYDFRTVEQLYTRKDSPKPTFVKIGEHRVPLPKPPPDKDCINYGLPKKDQKFRRIRTPRGIRNWEDAKENAYVEAEWHKRWNGVWIFIKGKKLYFPGSYYTFLNYWKMETGNFPTHRMEALEYFLFWEYCRDHPNCLGMLIIKCRRLGDTEKALFCLWDEATRWRYTYCGMQNYNGDQAKKNFKRLVMGAENMVYFFKPKTRGTDNPEKVLEFQYPEEKLTKKKLQQKQEEDLLFVDNETSSKGLQSKIDHAPTVIRAYDGSRLRIYYLDEAGKVKVSDMNVIKQLGIVSKSLSLYNDQLIIGKQIITTTVEDVESGKTVEVMRKLWKNSDPSTIGKNGRTNNGLFRLFRGYKKASMIDEFGEHKTKQAEQVRKDTIEQLTKAGLIDEVIQLKRQQPASVEESLVTPTTDCIILPHLLDRIINQHDNNLDWNNRPRTTVRPGRRGRLQWAGGHRLGDVQWIDDPEGPWFITQHPIAPNRKEKIGRHIAPGASTSYGCGIDPIDHTVGSGSKLAIVVKRKLDLNAEEGLEFDSSGRVINDWKMKTDQIVCHYLERPNSERDIIENVLLTLFYYGCPGLFETQKAKYIVNNMNESMLHHYVQMRPHETLSDMKAGKTTNQGAPATTPIISLYVDAIRAAIDLRPNCEHHIEVVRDHREFNMKNRTKRDLTVARGFAELACLDSTMKKNIEAHQNKWVRAPWSFSVNEEESLI